MKKGLIISIVTIAMFSMVSCSGNTTDVNVPGKEVDSTVESSNNNNKGEVKEPTSKEEGTDNSVEEKTDSTEQETDTSENEVKDDTTVSLSIKQDAYIGYDKAKEDENIKSLEEKYKGKGINTIVFSSEGSEYIEIIETSKDVTNVTMHSLGEEFYACDMDLDIYMEKYKELNTNTLAKKLSSNDVIILPCNVGEGIPQIAISWIEPSGKFVYQAISYNGKGE